MSRKMSLRTASEVTAGILLILEGAAVAFVAATFVFMGAPAAIGLAVLVMLLAGACFAWGGAVLAGFLRRDGRVAAVCTLIVGGLLSVLVHGLMLVASCGGGVNCPSTMPIGVYATPVALAVFNVAMAVLLWFKRSKQLR
jgi:hypothetical protein